MTHKKITLVDGTAALAKQFYEGHITALGFLWQAVAINLDVEEKGWRNRRAVAKRSKEFKDTIDDICEAIGGSVVGSGRGKMSQKTFDNYKTQVKHALIFGVALEDANSRFNTLLKAEDMVLEKVKDKDITYLSVNGKTPEDVWAAQMSIALAEVKDEKRRASRKPQESSGNGSAVDADVSHDEMVLPNPHKFQKPSQVFLAWLEANLDWSEDEAVSKAAESDDPLVVACVALLGKMSVLKRNHRPKDVSVVA